MRRSLLPLLVAAALAVALLVLTSAVPPRPASAFVLEVEALLVAIAAPLFASRWLDGERVPWAAAVFAPIVAVAAVVRGASADDALLAQVLLALFATSSAGLTILVGRLASSTAGLVAGLAFGALLLGFPYFGGDVVSALPRRGEEAAIHGIVAACPAVAAAGTFGGVDVFHETVLYDRFHPVQDVGCQYATPLRALGTQGVIAFFVCGLALLFKRRAVASLALVAFLAMPAQAQVFGGGEPGAEAGEEGEIGPLQTRVKLGYWVAFVDGNYQVKGIPIPASRFDLRRDLKLRPDYALPNFEIEFGWTGAGRVGVDYFEQNYHGDFVAPQQPPAIYKNIIIGGGDVGVVRYQFRTIGFTGSLDIPALDWLTLRIIGGARYVHFFSETRGPRTFQKDAANFDGYIPRIGPGIDVFVTDKVYVYGDLAWLDFSLFGSKPNVHYREIHGGVRLELLEHAHVGAEYRLLEIGVSDRRKSHRQRLQGPNIWVAVAF